MNKARRPIDWLIAIYIFVLPWQTMWIWREQFIAGAKWQYGTMVVYASQILLWLILIGQLLAWLKCRPISAPTGLMNLAGQYWHKNPRRYLVLAIWLLVLWPLISVLWSLDKQLAFYAWLQLSGAIGLLVILLARSYRRICLAWPLMLAGLLQGLLAIGQFFSQQIMANKWLGLSGHWPGDLGTAVVETADGRWLRAYGSFGHPNALGGFLAISFLAGLFVYNHYRPGGKRIIAAISLAAIAGGLFFSFSRSAWLALIVGVIFWLVIYWRYGRPSKSQAINSFKPLAYALVIFVLLLSIYWPLFSERASLGERLEIKSAQERISLMSEAKDVIQANWLLGVGLGNYTLVVCRQYPLRLAFDCQPAHNLYLLIFAELGLIGLCLVMAFVGLIFKHISRYRDKSWPLAWLVLLFILSLFDHYLWTSYVGLMLLWLVLAMVLIEDRSI